MVAYPDYLQLDKLLSAQVTESGRQGEPARDELLFIIIHQTYELWFKQILHELDQVESRFVGDVVDDAQIGEAAHALDRIVEIFKVLVQQIDILETMTPLDFLDFRDLLVPASGFQSFQFRLVELRLGLRRDDRLKFDGKPFESKLKPSEQAQILELEKMPSLADLLERWLERTPFVNMGDYQFDEAYQSALGDMFDNERAILIGNKTLGDEEKGKQLKAIDASEISLQGIMDEEQIESHQASGDWRFGPKALKAALFINLYRDEPALQIPFRLLRLLMDIDEMMAGWRHRHALMAQRMIGRKVGTGGSSGHDYLRAAAESYRVFGDLFQLTTYLIPRSALPPLPDKVRLAMRYQYSGSSGT